jgi:3-methyladenine DNA glycosylase AlkD
MLEVEAQARALTAALRALAPEPTSSSIIKTSRPFYGVKVGELRRLARTWAREHHGTASGQVVDLAGRLWMSGIREEQLVACFLVGAHPTALPALQLAQVRSWLPLLDNWETTDQLAMVVLGPMVALDVPGRFEALEQLTVEPHPWARRAGLVACVRVAKTPDAVELWPRVAGMVLGLADDRQAALPKAISWVLREYLGCCAAEVVSFVDEHAEQLPSVAVREVRTKLRTGVKRHR